MEIPFEVGGTYFIRAITYHMVGRVVRVVGKFLELSDAAWIPVSGRFMQFIRDGQIGEAEPVTGAAWVNLDAIVDAFEWRHVLPLNQK